ncbi:MAG: hypothetical protein ACR2PF_06710 [Rhizobiaceae bacterium]
MKQENPNLPSGNATLVIPSGSDMATVHDLNLAELMFDKNGRQIDVKLKAQITETRVYRDPTLHAELSIKWNDNVSGLELLPGGSSVLVKTLMGIHLCCVEQVAVNHLLRHITEVSLWEMCAGDVSDKPVFVHNVRSWALVSKPAEEP